MSETAKMWIRWSLPLAVAIGIFGATLTMNAGSRKESVR